MENTNIAFINKYTEMYNKVKVIVTEARHLNITTVTWQYLNDSLLPFFDGLGIHISFMGINNDTEMMIKYMQPKLLNAMDALYDCTDNKEYPVESKVIEKIYEVVKEYYFENISDNEY